MNTHAKKQALCAALDSIRDQVNIVTFQHTAEAALVEIVNASRDRPLALDRRLETSLWLAAERLVSQGMLAYGERENSYVPVLAPKQMEVLRLRLIEIGVPIASAA